MGRLQATTGLITGLPIVDTVNQLIAIEARPRDLTASRNKILASQQVAVAELTAATIAVQLAAKNLANTAIFNKKTVSSSNPAALSATLTGNPLAGSHQFTPVRRAQSHQLLSGGFASKEDPLGAGTFAFGFGGFIDRGLALAELNDGQGVQRGKIRITDRSGDSAVVDLRYAQTVDDVLLAINTTDGVNVEAVVDGDAFRLIDKTGGAGNLKVEEVSGGSTAQDLGLAGINLAADEALGQDLIRLYSGLSLSKLNDGNGVNFSAAVPELEVKFHDGSSLLVDFLRTSAEAQAATGSTVASGGADAVVKVTADTAGAAYNGIYISYVDDPGVTKGQETVVYDDSDPDNKTLTIHIEAGQSTANDVIAAINADPVASPLFTADKASGGTGEGLVTVSDQGLTAGGEDAVAATNEQTIGDLLQTLNEADPARLEARISADGDRLELLDLTAGGAAFEIKNFLSGSAASDLGLTGDESAGVIASRRLRGGLKSALLSSLQGGRGFEGGLGQLALTDRSGAADTVDLAGAQTLDDVVKLINAAAVGITASVNNARNGLQLQDTTGATAFNLIVADGADGLETATKLRLATDAGVARADSGALDLQLVNRHTRLDEYNGGIAKGSFIIQDSSGALAVIKTTTVGVETLGDLIDAINNASVGVEARLNDRGDGIAIIDTAGGEQTLDVREVGQGTTAADLHILGQGVEQEIDGQTRQVVEGSSGFRVEIDEDDSLVDLVGKINALGAGVTASIFSDGSGGTPHRLSLISQQSGKAGELLVDASAAGFSFEEITRAQDALLLIGGGGQGGGVLASSSDNHFAGVLEGVSLVVNDASASPVTVTVAATDSSVVSNVQLFVDQYNKLAKKLDDLTFFNETEKTTGVLFGSIEALRVETELSSLLSGRFFGVGSIQSLEGVGIGFNDDGTLSLDAAKLQAKFAADPAAVEKFFADEKLGLSKKVDALVETLAGRDRSLLVSRSETLQRRIDLNNERILFLNDRLERKRQLLLTQFTNMEIAIGKLQNNLTAIAAIQPLPSLISSG